MTAIRLASWFIVVFSACNSAPPPPRLDLPERPEGAVVGSQLARELRSLDLDAREERLYAELASGNVPTWLRQLRPVDMSGEVDGIPHDVVFWVTPDYLAVGSDEDHLLAPMSPQLAQRVADLLHASLPTSAMVDAVWRSAGVRLAPQRLQPRDSVESVRTVEYFERHHGLIQAQRMVRGVRPDEFVAGHKKDVVLSATLPANPGKVAVYGWHRPDGRPNQELSTVAPDNFVYYHHGIRLAHRRVLVDGADRDLPSLLGDPRLARLLSDEGVLGEPRYPASRTEPGEG